MLISNILLINLLIAMFSFTFQRVQDKSELIWRFYRFGLISEYHNRPTLVPPLIVINHVYRLIIELKQRFSPDKEEESNSLRVHLKKGSRIDEDVNLFESKHLQSYFIKESIKEKKSSQSMVTSAAERLTKVEERLDNLEKHVAEILKMVSAKEFKESKNGEKYCRNTENTEEIKESKIAMETSSPYLRDSKMYYQSKYLKIDRGQAHALVLPIFRTQRFSWLTPEQSLSSLLISVAEPEISLLHGTAARTTSLFWKRRARTKTVSGQSATPIITIL
ncbi:transient receptor potential cation channel subfamily M member 5-like [Ptychodera flava]|uniref:transient receptor potential cation channel subfamily M member 5-like n=1 Tax=Ptychodera flava TaxID=63121 RepID=UPI003969E0A7